MNGVLALVFVLAVVAGASAVKIMRDIPPQQQTVRVPGMSQLISLPEQALTDENSSNRPRYQ
jgi:hypothetical protein